MLCCLGDLLEDIAVHRPDHIRTGADTHVRIERRRGGSAANTAVAAARLGLPVRFIGRVGDDAVGVGLVEDLERDGVDACVQVGGRTGTILVLLEPDGDRSMLGDRGAAADLDVLVAPGLDGIRWLHVPAYSLIGGSVSRVAAEALFAAREAGVVTSIDASSLTLMDDPVGFRSLVSGLAPVVVFANEDEHRVLGDHAEWLGADTTLVVKRGPGPATSHGVEGVLASVAAERIGEVPDTTGAGDAFAAGYIAARLDDATEEECLRAGHQSAASWITGR